MRVNSYIDFDFYLNKEKGEEIVFYPYETTCFTTSHLMTMDRNDCLLLERRLREKATKKYDGWGTGKFIPINGAEHDNKCTFTIKGIAFHFHDFKLWIYPESSMEIGRF